MANTKDISLDTRFFSLFKGDPGSGKSVAAASYPKPYIIDNDDRIKGVIKFWRPRGKEFEYDHFSTFDDTNKKLEELLGYCPFETIVYDGITIGSDIILRTMVDTRAPNPNSKTNRGGIKLLEIEDYGGEMRGLVTIIENLKALSFRWKLNVIVTAHVIETESTNIKTKVTTTSRQLLTAGKKVAAALPSHFDEAYHFDVVPGIELGAEPQYTVVTKNVGWDWAKTALPLPLRMDFTNKSLYDMIMSNLEGYEFVHAPNELLIDDGTDIRPASDLGKAKINDW